LEVKIQKNRAWSGLNLAERILLWLVKGKVVRITIAAAMVITPPNLLGIARRIA